MLKTRVIPCLLLSDNGLVKTCRFSSPKYVGDPINAIRIFNEKEVDEIIVLDISASYKEKEPNYCLVEMFAGECFMPLCYGGGISSLDQASKLFSLGVEKVCLQTAVLDDVSLIREIVSRYGSQSVVVSVDVKKNWLGKRCLYSAARKKTLKKSFLDYIESTIEAGAGEILLNSVDRDGTMSGMDLEVISQVAGEVSIPLIASGGVGSIKDMKDAVDAGASAIAAGAFFVFHGPHRAVLITYPKYEELERELGMGNNDE
ncbi:MAG: imidazole glycerol phosphate synthase subunit HisF [Deltaproteobacteria bacterium]|nr:MAG: imidazole glycerol phosphate synthase subunit HisF [Deltaproteobacteria bacterium]